jgi:hypothetical protein
MIETQSIIRKTTINTSHQLNEGFSIAGFARGMMATTAPMTVPSSTAFAGRTTAMIAADWFRFHPPQSKHHARARLSGKANRKPSATQVSVDAFAKPRNKSPPSKQIPTARPTAAPRAMVDGIFMAQHFSSRG